MKIKSSVKYTGTADSCLEMVKLILASWQWQPFFDPQFLCSFKINERLISVSLQ